jgi:lipopolysaccharide export system protein LptA
MTSRKILMRRAMAPLVIAFVIAGASMAQISKSDAPVEVTAERVEAVRSDGRVVYSGKVVVTQGDSRITSDLLTVVCAREPAVAGQPQDQSCAEIEQMIAEGNVFYTTAAEKIRGDRAEYDYRNDTITMTGDVIMSRGEEGVIRGTRLVYDVAGGRATVTAGSASVLSIFTPVEREEPKSPQQP